MMKFQLISFLGVALSLLTNSGFADIIARYHFDESSGTTAFDSIGSVNGTLSGGASFVGGGISGNALDLTGAGDLVNMGNNFGFTSGDFSVVFWINTTATGINNIPLSKHTAGFTNDYFFAINQNGGGGQLNKATFVASQTVIASATSTTSVNDGTWHQIVGVHVNGGINSIYVDGAPLEASVAASPMVASSAPFLLGGFFQSGSPISSFTGLIDELQIYNHALSNNEITYLFNNPAQSVPEPGAMTLLAASVICLAARRRRLNP